MSVETLTPDERARYDHALATGAGPNLALIIATQTPPRQDRQSERWRRDGGIAADGRKVKGKYQAGVAKYPGDPDAFFTSKRSALEAAKRRGLTVHHGPPNHDDSNQMDRARVKREREKHQAERG